MNFNKAGGISNFFAFFRKHILSHQKATFEKLKFHSGWGDGKQRDPMKLITGDQSFF